MDINYQLLFYNFYHILLAWLLALPIAINREHESRSAGIRTFPLVSIGACGFMLTGLDVLSSDDARSRIMYGLITGIGFIGGGAIVKTETIVSGTATAASLWCTGAIGIAVAWNKFEIAAVLSLINYLTLKVKDVRTEAQSN